MDDFLILTPVGWVGCTPVFALVASIWMAFALSGRRVGSRRDSDPPRSAPWWIMVPLALLPLPFVYGTDILSRLWH